MLLELTISHWRASWRQSAAYPQVALLAKPCNSFQTHGDQGVRSLPWGEAGEILKRISLTCAHCWFYGFIQLLLLNTLRERCLQNVASLIILGLKLFAGHCTRLNFRMFFPRNGSAKICKEYVFNTCNDWVVYSYMCPQTCPWTYWASQEHLHLFSPLTPSPPLLLSTNPKQQGHCHFSTIWL